MLLVLYLKAVINFIPVLNEYLLLQNICILCFHMWMLYQQEWLESCGWCRVNNLVITHTLVHNVHKDTFDAVRSIFHATSHMTAAGRRTERALSEWAWLILVLVNSRCSGADICAWMRQRRQSKRGDEAAFCLSGGCESMRQNWMLFWINEAPQPKATRQRGTRGKCNFFFLCVLSLLFPVWQWWTALTCWGEENTLIT